MAEAGILRVVSWNVHAWRGGDGREDAERFGRILCELKPDIVGLQEVVNRYDGVSGSPELDRVAEQTGMKAVNGPTITRVHSDYGNALLTTGSIREVRHIDLSFPNREPRAALDVDLDVADHTLRVIVTHFGLRPAERRFQVRRMVNAIEERASEKLILMGDLNEWLLFGRPARWLHKQLGRSRAPATFPAIFPLFALDRIFVDFPQALVEIRCIRTSEARAASDHLPVEALVRPEGRRKLPSPLPKNTNVSATAGPGRGS